MQAMPSLKNILGWKIRHFCSYKSGQDWTQKSKMRVNIAAMSYCRISLRYKLLDALKVALFIPTQLWFIRDVFDELSPPIRKGTRRQFPSSDRRFKDISQFVNTRKKLWHESTPFPDAEKLFPSPFPGTSQDCPFSLHDKSLRMNIISYFLLLRIFLFPLPFEIQIINWDFFFGESCFRSADHDYEKTEEKLSLCARSTVRKEIFQMQMTHIFLQQSRIVQVDFPPMLVAIKNRCIS